MKANVLRAFRTFSDKEVRFIQTSVPALSDRVSIPVGHCQRLLTLERAHAARRHPPTIPRPSSSFAQLFVTLVVSSVVVLLRRVAAFLRQVDDMDLRSRSVLFSLCYFHAIMVERLRFGPIGFNKRYPFSQGMWIPLSVRSRSLSISYCC